MGHMTISGAKDARMGVAGSTRRTLNCLEDLDHEVHSIGDAITFSPCRLLCVHSRHGISAMEGICGRIDHLGRDQIP